MGSVQKPLGQVASQATTLEDLYTVPENGRTTTSSLIVCNRAAGSRSYRIAVRPQGAAVADKHYLYYDVSIAANDTFAAILGLTLQAGDVVSVYASAADLTFSLFGVETT